MRNILLSLFVCCMFIACEEEKLEPYTGNDTVQFYTTNFDEDIVVEYSWGMALDPNAECRRSLRTLTSSLTRKDTSSSRKNTRS